MRSAALPCLALALLASCRAPVADAEAALAAGQPLSALRLSRDALTHGKFADEAARNRLGAVIQAAARSLLDAPDQGTWAEAQELLDAMPDGTEERQRAAQRLLRIHARTSDESGFRAALAGLWDAMGDEAAVRSNLRALAQSARGQPAAVWASKEVVRRWPDNAERWLDLAAAQAGVAGFADARASVEQAILKLEASCADLAERMAGYDEVRRNSAYGQLELQRCQGFHRLASAWAAYERGQPKPPGKGRDDTPAHAAARCPASASALTAPGTAALLLTPAPQAWWVDGKAVAGRVAQVGPGAHTVSWKDKGGCREAKVDAGEGEAVAVRTAPLR